MLGSQQTQPDTVSPGVTEPAVTWQVETHCTAHMHETKTSLQRNKKLLKNPAV